MSHSILRAADAPDFAKDADSPFLGYGTALESEQLGVNLRVLAPGVANVPPGVDPATGHSHEGIEEVYVVLEGEVTVKVGDETVTLGPRDAIRIDPETRRAARNDGDVPAAMLMVSVKMTDPRGQSHFHEGFLQDRA